MRPSTVEKPWQIRGEAHMERHDDMGPLMFKVLDMLFCIANLLIGAAHALRHPYRTYNMLCDYVDNNLTDEDVERLQAAATAPHLA